MKTVIGLSAAYVLGGAEGIIAKLIDILLEKPDKKQIEQRLVAIEDPILALDHKMESVCLILYEAFKIKTMPRLSYVQLAEDAHKLNERQLRLLKSKDLITFDNAAGCSTPLGIQLKPDFTVYIGLKSADRFEIASAIHYIDSQPSNLWINGHQIADKYKLHIDMVWAIFHMRDEHGLGSLSREEMPRYFNN